MPKVSVVIPSYNHARFAGAAPAPRAPLVPGLNRTCRHRPDPGGRLR